MNSAVLSSNSATITALAALLVSTDFWSAVHVRTCPDHTTAIGMTHTVTPGDNNGQLHTYQGSIVRSTRAGRNSSETWSKQASAPYKVHETDTERSIKDRENNRSTDGCDIGALGVVTTTLGMVTKAVHVGTTSIKPCVSILALSHATVPLSASQDKR